MDKNIEILEYNNQLSQYIKSLNYEWLQKYFSLEASDVESLADPQKYIIDKGGYIFYAKLNNEIVGTVSLMKKQEQVFELGKMAVTESAQGFGIGAKLLEHSIVFAIQKGIKSLVLYTNTKLLSAIHLYSKYGFTETELEPGLYKRANLKMQKHIS
jgi:N-acetylglutamate synthase-like GNAT family acetyltransferase